MSVGAQAPGLAAFGRNDVQLAVRHQQHVVLGLAEDDPLAVRGELREVVALAVVGGALDGLGSPAAAAIEGNPVQIELERLLVFDELGDILLAEQDARGIRDGRGREVFENKGLRIRIAIYLWLHNEGGRAGAAFGGRIDQ